MEMGIDLRPRNFVRLLVDVLVQEWPLIEAKKDQVLKARWLTYATFPVISEPEVRKMMAGFMIQRNLNVKLFNILELVEMLIGIFKKKHDVYVKKNSAVLGEKHFFRNRNIKLYSLSTIYCQNY